jgi:hypothetical protein
MTEKRPIILYYSLKRNCEEEKMCHILTSCRTKYWRKIIWGVTNSEAQKWREEHRCYLDVEWRKMEQKR